MSTNSFKNSPYSDELGKKHDDDFVERHSIDSFNEKMSKIREDIDPRFLAQFDRYRDEVSSLLSENVSCANSPIVQKELATQNARVSLALSTEGKYAKTLNDSYAEVML
jgi:uncharacterized protein YktB (UPF0637 family)